MSLVLELPRELETELEAEAAELGLPLPEYVLRLLAAGRGPSPVPRTGAQLLAYWHDEGLVGTRTDIAESSAHARALRDQAQRRARP
ncbi:MAG: hypothetical protein HY040_11175 [Planctomycetes bacterium]|nr:hypothetical protein [Planctomycetota bacterium]